MPLSQEKKRQNKIAKRKRWCKKYPQKVRARQKRWNEKNPQKVKAYQKVHRAVKSGRLVRRPCLICGYDVVEGHHEDHSKPLDVWWLCRPHHIEWHELRVI